TARTTGHAPTGTERSQPYRRGLQKGWSSNERWARLERLWLRYGTGGMFAGEVVLIDLPACFVLCERIDSTPLWLEGIWTREGQEETALERLQNAWLYDTAEKDGR
ncbi:hypothetical protein ACWGCF_45300, partial [Streptomyces sp. NPDC055039]